MQTICWCVCQWELSHAIYLKHTFVLTVFWLPPSPTYRVDGADQDASAYAMGLLCPHNNPKRASLRQLDSEIHSEMQKWINLFYICSLLLVKFHTDASTPKKRGFHRGELFCSSIVTGLLLSHQLTCRRPKSNCGTYDVPSESGRPQNTEELMENSRTERCCVSRDHHQMQPNISRLVSFPQSRTLQTSTWTSRPKKRKGSGLITCLWCQRTASW